MSCNETLRKPRSPGPWVNEETCTCGAHYRRSRYGISWKMGVDLVRATNGGFEGGGGYRSKGPVLWAMRVIKLDAWYNYHRDCVPF